MTTRNQKKYRIIKPRYRTYTNFEEADKYGLSHKLLHNVYEEYRKYRHLEFLEDMPALDPAVNINRSNLTAVIDYQNRRLSGKIRLYQTQLLIQDFPFHLC